MQLQLDARHNAVSGFINEASEPTLPPTVQAHLLRFGTVLVCGYVERCVEIIIMDRLSNRAHPKVLNFVKSFFKRGRNLDCNALAELLNRFDADWYRKFNDAVAANPRMKEGVSSCYAFRNTISHGGSASVTHVRLNELLVSAKSLVDIIVKATEGR